MSNGDTYKDLIAFKNDSRTNKKKPVKLGYVKVTADGKQYLQFDTIPAGGWWDGSVIISERRDDDSRGGGGGFGGRRPSFGDDRRSNDDDMPF